MAARRPVFLSALWNACLRLKRSLVGEDVWTGPGWRRGTVSAEIPDMSYTLGDGAHAVLLVHGLTGTPVEMRYVAKHLAAAGFTVYAVQLSGHCGTEGDLLQTTWRDWTASVDAAYVQLAERHTSVSVAGLSVGAIMALYLAANRPVASVILYSPSFWYDGWALPRLSFLMPLILASPLYRFYRLVEIFPYGLKDDRLRKLVSERMLSGDSAGAGTQGAPGASLREMQSLNRWVKRRLSSITVPALIVHSSEDDIASLRNANFIEARLGGPVRKVVLDDCYHLIVLDRQRTRVVEETVRFLEALSPTPHSALSPRRLVANCPV